MGAHSFLFLLILLPAPGREGQAPVQSNSALRRSWECSY